MSDKIENRLLRKAVRYGKLLRLVPYVKMVAVCNNLAFGSVDEDSDIDLFVVAERGKLFTVRILITFLLHVAGVRRHGEKVAERFCLSFFIDEDHADLSKIALNEDYYLAFWVNNLLPLIDNGRFIAKFLDQNSWSMSFFPAEFEAGFSDKILLSDSVLSSWGRNFLKLLFGWNFIENNLERWQLKRSALKSKSVGNESSLIISKGILKFHNIDRRRFYNLKWREQFGGSPLEKERFKKIISS